MKNIENNYNFKIESQEKPPRPDLIVDFIRHGTAVYGNKLKEKLSEIGQDTDTFKLMPEISANINDEREQLEGKITEKGENELRESIRKLSKLIDHENEIITVLQGTRTRHEQSGRIIINELQNQGIKVVKQKNHESLLDVKNGGWYKFVEYIVKHQNQSEADLEQFWWDMYQKKNVRDDMSSKGYEHLGDIALRTENMLELLKRFVRRFNLGKTLRVIAVTSDVNIEQIQQKGINIENKDQLWVKNADIFEINIWNDKDDPLKYKEKTIKPLESL
jgi:hypothetical protein